MSCTCFSRRVAGAYRDLVGRLHRSTMFVAPAAVVARAAARAGCLATAACWPLVARAQVDGSAVVVNSDKSYVAQYTIIGLCLALALSLLCRPSRRAEKVEPRLDL